MKKPASTRDASFFPPEADKHEALRCRYRPSGTGGTNPASMRGRFLRVPSVQVPRAELLPEGRNGEVAAGVVARARVEPHLPKATAEAHAGNVPPPLPDGSRALQAREPEAEALLVVRRLDPGRVLRTHEEQGAAGGLRVADVDGLLADVRVELDAYPSHCVRLELGSVALRVVLAVVGEETELLLIREHAVPAPLVVLSVDGPLPRQLGRVLERVERRVEDDDRLGVVRIELGGGFGADPRELAEVDALRRTARLEGREHVDGGVEHTVDEAEGRELVELAHPLLRHLVVAGELGDPLGRETEPTQATDELDDLRTTELRSEVLTGHGDLPFL